MFSWVRRVPAVSVQQADPPPRTSADPALSPPRPPLRPAHLALHLHGAQAAAARAVPVAAVHAARWARGGLPGQPSGARAASARPLASESGRGPGRLVTAPAEAASALSSAGRVLTRRDRGSDWPLAGRGHGSLPPGLGAAAAVAEERAEQRPQTPQSRSLPPPPRARARVAEPGQSRSACARSPAASERPRPLALRPHPIGSAHLRPRRQPITIRLLRCVGGLPS